MSVSVNTILVRKDWKAGTQWFRRKYLLRPSMKASDLDLSPLKISEYLPMGLTLPCCCCCGAGCSHGATGGLPPPSPPSPPPSPPPPPPPPPPLPLSGGGVFPCGGVFPKGEFLLEYLTVMKL